MTTTELILIAIIAALWLLGGSVTNAALIALRLQEKPRVITFLLWPFMWLYAILTV